MIGPSMEPENRYSVLLHILRSFPAAAVALSGGIDSSLLLAAAFEALPGRVCAFTVKTPYTHRPDIDGAAKTAAFLGVDHTVIDTPEVPKEILANPKDRCYRCKLFLFRKIIEAADAANTPGRKSSRGNPPPQVLDGMNADETGEHRPGIRALEELGIRSPLAEAGLTKNDIRQLSLRKGLPAAEAPSGSCLLTRFPYGMHISDSDLSRVAAAEEALAGEGFAQVRVRVHGDIARIEVPKEELKRFFDRSVDLSKTAERLKELGFRYVTLDLEGFRSGSMD